jgi:hypothetical protein
MSRLHLSAHRHSTSEVDLVGWLAFEDAGWSYVVQAKSVQGDTLHVDLIVMRTNREAAKVPYQMSINARLPLTETVTKLVVHVKMRLRSTDLQGKPIYLSLHIGASTPNPHPVDIT